MESHDDCDGQRQSEQSHGHVPYQRIVQRTLQRNTLLLRGSAVAR
jgi:hypothetical protein